MTDINTTLQNLEVTQRSDEDQYQKVHNVSDGPDD